MSGFVTGAPRTILRLEGLAVFAICVFFYHRLGSGWVIFALFWLVPDLSMLAYFAGKQVGAAGYNIGHSYLGPLGLIAYGHLVQCGYATSAGLIWGSHIGFDRLIGYGLKYGRGFNFTHLGQSGKVINEGKIS